MMKKIQIYLEHIIIENKKNPESQRKQSTEAATWHKWIFKSKWDKSENKEN